MLISLIFCLRIFNDYKPFNECDEWLPCWREVTFRRGSLFVSNICSIFKNKDEKSNKIFHDFNKILMNY